MEIVSYNFFYTLLNRVEICLESKKNKVMVWCDEEDYYVIGRVNSSQCAKIGDNAPRIKEVAHTLGEVLTQMIGRYR